MELEYRKGRVPIMEREEYCDLLIEFLERLPPTMTIHRVTGDAPRDYLVAPLWPLRKAEFLHLLDRELLRRNAWQGKKFDRLANVTA